MCCEKFLESLGLLEINGFIFEKKLGGGSALSSLYKKGSEKLVFKFLISPRNKIEVERFKLEFSVLDKNKANTLRVNGGFEYNIGSFVGPESSYPLPIIKYSLTSKFNGLVYYFAYAYEEGQLLSQIDTSDYKIEDSIFLLYRLASGLNYFNQTGYSHRDLHPENIILLDGYHMPDSNRFGAVNDPRVKFLDMGSCQRTDTQLDWIQRIDRNLDEDAVFQDNNRRILASFISMPPDFLEKGEKTKNYDTWSFGVYAYNLLFGEMPINAKQIGDLASLRDFRCFSDSYMTNLNTLPVGLKLIINHLLSPNGDDRPTIDAIVRLFSGWVDRTVNFQDENYVKRLIHNGGFDPDSSHDDYY